MPPLGLLLGKVDFTNLYLNMSGGDYASLAAAKEAGAATLNYGVFINNIIGFLIVAFAVFLLVRSINRLRKLKEAEPKAPEANEKPCPYCATTIPLAATRCPHCTSQLEEPAA
jgi:large conductance mechanosensitive channel